MFVSQPAHALACAQQQRHPNPPPLGLRTHTPVEPRSIIGVAFRPARSYLGIGDSFWKNDQSEESASRPAKDAIVIGILRAKAKAAAAQASGDKEALAAANAEEKKQESYGEWANLQQLEEMLKLKYGDKEAMVLEMVKPKKKMFESHQPGISDVHSIGIVTMRTPDDDVKVVSVLIWADCTTSSSHSTQAGYSVDLETETIQDACGWYSAYFATMKTPLKGMKVPNIREACQKAVDGHRSIKYKWLVAVGWDCMVMDNDEVRAGQVTSTQLADACRR